MRTIAITLLLISSLSWAGNAEITRSKNVLRIDCREKNNLLIRSLPTELLKAFQNGEIKAYYPLDHNVEMPYSAFIKHYGLELPHYDEAVSSDIKCPQLTYQLDPYLLGCLTKYFEIEEVQSFDKNRSVTQHHPKYIKLLMSYECSYTGLEYYGPVFKYDDIKKLKTKVINPKNNAVTYSLQNLLELRLFNACLVKKGDNDHYEKPSEKGSKEHRKQVEKEIEYFSN